MKGTIFDIKRFAVHDGPGIRTTVFLKGCPLCCAWCHNPESQAFGITITEEATAPIGQELTVDELIGKLIRDTPFFDESGGGVTCSGGEPLAQPEFLLELLQRCGELDIHRAVDTSGHAPREVLLDIATQTDLFLYDLKLMHIADHREHTGVDPRLIQDNLRALCATKVPVEIRIPVVPNFTGTRENISALTVFIASLDRALPVRLLAHHRAAMDKYPRFGLTSPLPDVPEPGIEELDQLRGIIRSHNLETLR